MDDSINSATNNAINQVMSQEALLDLPVYEKSSQAKQDFLNKYLTALTTFHHKHCALYANFINAWHPQAHQKELKLDSANQIIPFAVRHFKNYQLKSVSKEKVFRTLHSSGTSGQPSAITLDNNTAKLQSTVLVKTLQHWLGKARRPMLIIDAPSTMKNNATLTARAAGIRGFSMFGRQHCYALNDDLNLNIEAITDFFNTYKTHPVLIFGFTFIVWQKFILALKQEKLTFTFDNATLFHGGGWKKMVEASVNNETFKATIKEHLGHVNIHDYYGMVEQTGTIHVECEHGYLHTPIWSDVMIRRPSDLGLMKNNELGLIQVNSVIAQSYPGHCLLTEDLGMIIGEDDCQCGRKGKYFIVKGRVPSAEKRGCSDTFS